VNDRTHNLGNRDIPNIKTPQTEEQRSGSQLQNPQTGNIEMVAIGRAHKLEE
jgi:hypothetical protein